MNDRLKKSLADIYLSCLGRTLIVVCGTLSFGNLWKHSSRRAWKPIILKTVRKLWEDCHSKLLCVFVCCWHLCQTKRRKSSPTSLSFCQCTDHSICQNLSYTEFTVVTPPPWWTTLWFYCVFRILRQIWNKWIFKGKVYKTVLTHFRCDKK